MRRKITSIFVVSAVILTTALTMVPGHTAGTASLGDADDDVMSATLNHRVHGVQKANPMPQVFDIRSFGFEANGGVVKARMTVDGTFPLERCPATNLGCDFPAGTSAIDLRYLFQTTFQESIYTIGRNCFGGTERVVNPLDGNDIAAPLTYDNGECFDSYDGPFPKVDGWWLMLNVEASRGSGANVCGFSGSCVVYDWGWGWFDEMNAIFFTLIGCGGKDANGNCTGAHDLTMQLEGRPTCSFGAGNGPQCKANITGQGTNTLTIEAPYHQRADDGEDYDGFADEQDTYKFFNSGHTISAVVASTAGTISQRVPPEPVCPFPADPDDCAQTGVGLTFSADWTPGNPFSNPSNPDWGGYLPRFYPRSRSWHPGIGAAFCNQPAGFNAYFGTGLGVTTRDQTPALTGFTVHNPQGGDAAYVKAFRHPRDDNGQPSITGLNAPEVEQDVPLLVQPQACFHIYDPLGLHYQVDSRFPAFQVP